MQWLSVKLGRRDDYGHDRTAVLRPREDNYAESNPKPEDVLLVIEVSDSTVAYDAYDMTRMIGM